MDLGQCTHCNFFFSPYILGAVACGSLNPHLNPNNGVGVTTTMGSPVEICVEGAMWVQCCGMSYPVPVSLELCSCLKTLTQKQINAQI